MACRSREILSRNILAWLQDPGAVEMRRKAARANGGPLTMLDNFVGFSRWYVGKQIAIWDASEAESHMAISRGVPDMGSFVLAFELAERIATEDALRAAYRTEGLEPFEEGGR